LSIILSLRSFCICWCFANCSGVRIFSSSDPSSYDPKRGEGKFTTVELGAALDQAMATKGEEVSGVKCTSCHKTTDEKLLVQVGKV
jgi:hypothetical protein